VTCHDMDGVITSHSRSSVLPSEATEHIAGCERCRRLVRVLHETREVPTRSADHLKQIQSAMLADLRPVQPLAPSRVFLSAFVTIFLAVVAVGSLQLGAYGWGVLSALQRIVVFATLATGAGLLAFSMVRQMAPGGKHAIRPSLLPIGILVLLMLVIAAVFHSQEESAFVVNGLRCLRGGLTYAIPGAFLFWLLLRRGAILYPKPIGATAGGLAGLIGLTVLEVHCPNLNRYHILVWHLGVILVSALGGLALGAAVEYSQGRNNRIP
jgi:hypothetical protein